MSALKDEIQASRLARVGRAVQRAQPRFDAARFLARATDGLDQLELKGRIDHVADALADGFGDVGFVDAAEALATAAEADAMDAWSAWPLVTYVERHGLAEPEAALTAIARLTRHASGEFAIRPYLERHPEVTWARLRSWAQSDDPHLRRLASEGTRPRLPWRPRVRADLSPALDLLDRLRDDPDEHVRRSVANHLNDIAKDDPGRALSIARRWLAEGGEHTERVVAHGLRTLIKRGDPEALALVGADPAAPLTVSSLALSDARVMVGGALRFSFVLRSAADAPVLAIVDYVVHHVKASGARSPKVFKLLARSVGPGESVAVERAHSFREVTVRRYHSGMHRIEIQVNGVARASADFELVA